MGELMKSGLFWGCELRLLRLYGRKMSGRVRPASGASEHVCVRKG